VGTLNTVEAKVADPASGSLTLAGHAIRTSSSLKGAVGDPVIMALRPEMVTLDGIDGEPVPNANRVRSIVTDIAFLGSVVRVSVDIGDGTIVHVDTFNNPNLAVPPAGSPVMLSFPPEACLVLKTEDVSQEVDALAAAEAML
jgi:putative spermidine/putrescine transport system ATP-binding protein